MFSVNNFYNYLTNEYSYPQENIQSFVYKFKIDGSRDLSDLEAMVVPEELSKFISLYRYFGGIYLFDQEPLNLLNYHVNENTINHNLISKSFKKLDQFCYELARTQTSIICHSELNSSDINFLKDKGFLEVYYWYHGLIAQDWFRHWKYFKKTQQNNDPKRFGLYIRDASGERKYRRTLLTKISTYANNVHFLTQKNLIGQIDDNILNKWPESKISFGSDSSAIIDWNDSNKFKIQIVAETQFNSTKIHLTEKIFKPMVMNQAFILVAGPGGLAYLKRYGFRTFDSLWDESYDTITDHNERLDAIVKLITYLNALPSSEFTSLMEKAQQIIDYNRELFYSNKFTDRLLNELSLNMRSAICQQQENFLSSPDNVWMNYLETFHKNYGHIGESKQGLETIFSHLQKAYPVQSKKLVNRYGYLLNNAHK